VERDDRLGKFWLDPVRFHSSGGFRRTEIHRIQKIVEETHETLMEAWYDYFSG
jgi:hypothetical protein